METKTNSAGHDKSNADEVGTTTSTLGKMKEEIAERWVYKSVYRY